MHSVQRLLENCTQAFSAVLRDGNQYFLAVDAIELTGRGPQKTCIR